MQVQRYQLQPRLLICWENVNKLGKGLCGTWNAFWLGLDARNTALEQKYIGWFFR